MVEHPEEVALFDPQQLEREMAVIGFTKTTAILLKEAVDGRRELNQDFYTGRLYALLGRK